IAAFLLGFALQVAVTELPFMNEAFATAPLSLKEWAGITALCTVPLWFHELLRLVRASSRKRRAAVSGKTVL
ncbi:MAG: cation transporting ATPase C-terminal domain-containing protein, partial [Clostridiales Family XIII bacterium]|nr:cation transporting ATPase C-terminal domain-containing protein [Clostridiales Family XIII bacterium]